MGPETEIIMKILVGYVKCVFKPAQIVFKFMKNFYRIACLRLIKSLQIGFMIFGSWRKLVRGSPEVIYAHSCTGFLSLQNRFTKV